MNCTEANVLFGEAIDGFVPENARHSFFEHLGVCRSCRKALELESITKMIVRSRCARATAPSDVRHAIVTALRESSGAALPFFEWIQNAFTLRRLIPALIVSVAFAFALVFVISPSVPEESDAHTASNDVIYQSLHNFAQLQRGEVKPMLVASKAEDVHQYLDSEGRDFAIVHTMDCCTSYGALTSQYNGIKLAEVVYRMSGDVMCVYQVQKKSVFEGSTLIIPPAARTALEKTGWYTDPHHPNCNVVLWIADETLCAAVSSMKKDEMLAVLNRN